jgi:endonuclease-3
VESLAERKQRAVKIIQVLRKATKGMALPAITQIVNEFGRDPYLILISCLLSLRTKDTVSLPASRRLFHYARTPQEMLRVPQEKIAELIYPTGFYRQKAKLAHTISADLIERFGSKVPSTEADLLSLKGVGHKTANLVLGEGFGVPAICVDTHVHRISNRLGLVKSNTPWETEQQLKEVLPKKYWVEYNHLMVMWGQNICVPISPFCSKCAIFDCCERNGVKKSR